MALVIAPYLVAEKLKNPRDQLRLGNFITVAVRIIFIIPFPLFQPFGCFSTLQEVGGQDGREVFGE